MPIGSVRRGGKPPRRNNRNDRPATARLLSRHLSRTAPRPSTCTPPHTVHKKLPNRQVYKKTAIGRRVYKKLINVWYNITKSTFGDNLDFKVTGTETRTVRFMKFVVRMFKRKPEVTYLDGAMPQRAIFIANHSGASGPMTYRTYLTPPPMMIWAANEMMGGYKSRKRYLIDVFYGRKLGYGKFRARLCGTLFALVSGIIYNAGGTIPVYYDAGMRKTFAYSVECLRQGVSVLVFPENSDDGYNEELGALHRGYLTLAAVAKKELGEEIPVVPMYYSRRHAAIVVGKPHYASAITEELGKEGANEYFRNYINSLYTDYILKDKENEAAAEE